MVTAIDTNEVTNQSPPFVGHNLFTGNPVLGALVEGAPQGEAPRRRHHAGPPREKKFHRKGPRK